MGRCRHSGLSWRAVDHNRGPYGQAVTRWCIECADYVPWGPANDTADAIVEQRAAEIAATGASTYDCDGAELAGWIDASFDSAKVPDQSGERSGWLAYVIAHHEDP